MTELALRVRRRLRAIHESGESYSMRKLSVMTLFSTITTMLHTSLATSTTRRAWARAVMAEVVKVAREESEFFAPGTLTPATMNHVLALLDLDARELRGLDADLRRALADATCSAPGEQRDYDIYILMKAVTNLALHNEHGGLRDADGAMCERVDSLLGENVSLRALFEHFARDDGATTAYSPAVVAGSTCAVCSSFPDLALCTPEGPLVRLACRPGHVLHATCARLHLCATGACPMCTQLLPPPSHPHFTRELLARDDLRGLPALARHCRARLELALEQLEHLVI